jgi:hypothetical protein
MTEYGILKIRFNNAVALSAKPSHKGVSLVYGLALATQHRKVLIPVVIPTCIKWLILKRRGLLSYDKCIFKQNY